MTDKMRFYRYVDTNYTGTVRVEEWVFYLVRETPCGYWISSSPNYREEGMRWYGERKRWVSKTSRKRYAYPTRAEAKVSFKARKHRQVGILRNRLLDVEEAVRIFDNMELKSEPAEVYR
jgi:hypothetical protein